MTNWQIVYLIGSILGLVLPYSQIIPLVHSHGINWDLFYTELFANRISTDFAFDLLISSAIFWVFVFREGKKLQMKWLGIYIFFNLAVGLSFALPLFLWMRERHRPQSSDAKLNVKRSPLTT